MDFKELQDTLQKLTNSKISLTQIGQALDIKLSTVSTRVKNGSELKYNEIKKIERYFGVKLVKEKDFMQSPLTHKNEHIQKMINNIEIGIASYGVYWSLVETISEKGIKVGTEKEVAADLHIEEKYIKAILNDYELFYIMNGNYYSIFPEHHIDSEHFYANQFEDVKADILKEVEKMLEDRGINLR